MNNLKRGLEQPRGLNEFEKFSIIKMIKHLPDNDILTMQMIQAEVISVCDCGCKTVDLRVPTNLDKYICNRRVPVEMMVEIENDSAPVLFQLHVVDGYLNELEILKLDSTPICKEIDISKGMVETRRKKLVELLNYNVSCFAFYILVSCKIGNI